MAHFLHLTSLLPLDVLRLIFEYATADDKRTGVALATVSKRVQSWVEPILYSEVNLQRPHTKQLFLRTIESSKTKKLSFFATKVKTLCIAYDPNADERQTIKITSVCRAVVNLTFLSIGIEQRPRINLHPSYRAHGLTEEAEVPGFKPGLLFDSSFPFSGKAMRDQTVLILRKQNAMELRAALAELQPTHVSTLLPVSGPEAYASFPTDNPDTFLAEWSRPALPITLHLRLFLHTTHLSIQNKWEDWVAWTGYFDFARLPYLTHLSLDLRAGFSVPRSKSTGAHDTVFPVMDTHDAERACIIARAAQCILTQCPWLRVCALRLVFDSNPDRTAAAILAQMPLSKHMTSRSAVVAAKRTNPDVKKEDVEMVDIEEEEEEEEGSDESEDEEDVLIDMVDPRLVFLWDKEPFQHRYSHSKKECRMWRKAEEAVGRQSVGLGEFMTFRLFRAGP
ncbi:hypothetical protein APHAL10511_000410 [Amanita phalloides]|nr:hypothetical protein APHAL10511_000410 [Amanita phalloides]